MPEPIIRTEHLSRFFGTVNAVDDLTVEVPAGIVGRVVSLRLSAPARTGAWSAQADFASISREFIRQADVVGGAGGRSTRRDRCRTASKLPYSSLPMETGGRLGATVARRAEGSGGRIQ
jgi:hypothetical protein